MNSTLRSLLFWMVLVIVGVLIWNFSTTFQAREEVIPFSEFVQQLDTNKIDKVTITGQEIVATYKSGEKARTSHRYCWASMSSGLDDAPIVTIVVVGITAIVIAPCSPAGWR